MNYYMIVLNYFFNLRFFCGCFKSLSIGRSSLIAYKQYSNNKNN